MNILIWGVHVQEVAYLNAEDLITSDSDSFTAATAGGGGDCFSILCELYKCV